MVGPIPRVRGGHDKRGAPAMNNDQTRSNAEDSVDAFLADLRMLRDRHNPPRSFKGIAQTAGQRGIPTSHGSMHNVYRATDLPTEGALRSYVVALAGRDAVEPWITRRESLSQNAPGISESDHEPADTAFGRQPAEASRSARRPGRWWWIAAVAVLVLSNVTTGVVVAWSTQTTGPDTDSNSLLPATGTDPGTQPECLEDVVVAASSNEGQFLLKLLYSATCQSSWGKVDRTDNRGEGNTISLTAYRRADPEGPSTQRAVESDVQSAYTALILREDAADRICVSGAVTVGAETIEASRPLCN